jgi:hypothetical protein
MQHNPKFRKNKSPLQVKLTRYNLYTARMGHHVSFSLKGRKGKENMPVTRGFLFRWASMIHTDFALADNVMFWYPFLQENTLGIT